MNRFTSDLPLALGLHYLRTFTVLALVVFQMGIQPSFGAPSSSSPESAGPPLGPVTPSPTATPPQRQNQSVLDCKNGRQPGRFDTNKDGRLDLLDLENVKSYLAFAGNSATNANNQSLDVTQDGIISGSDQRALELRLVASRCMPPPTPTPTPTPVATATPRQACAWALGWASNKKGPSDSLEELADNFKISRSGDIPACFSKALAPLSIEEYKLLTKAGVIYAGRGGFNTQYNIFQEDSLRDFEAIIKWLGSRVNIPGGLNRSDYNRFRLLSWGVLGHPLIFFPRFGIPLEVYIDILKNPRNSSITMFFDRNCKYLPDAEGRKICGFAGVSWSPISLQWNPASDVSSDMRVVEFGLSNNPRERFSLWKASDAFPLLVFDPKHSGRVDSAESLFGNFTTSAVSTHSVRLQQGKDQPRWKNGYEALGVLDADGSGSLSGSELEPLALWFDSNRDGVSDPGEVRSLLQEGVVELFYKDPGSFRNSPRDIGLELGYRREQNGKIISGASVDWYAETFGSRVEGAQALSGILAALPDGSPKIPSVPAVAEGGGGLPRPPSVVSLKNQNVSGLWMWSGMDMGEERNPGVLHLVQDADGNLTGNSIVEVKLGPYQGDGPAAVSIVPLQGKVRMTSEGLTELVFEMKDDSTGSIAHTTAYVAPEGSMLVGRTTQKFSVEWRTPVSATASYAWIAGRGVNGHLTTIE